jgi:tetratricopeptide (TPR) repeat protein
LGDGPQARPDFEAALTGARAREDRHMEYEALAGLGRLLEFDLGDRAQGLQCLEEALMIAQSLGDRAGQVALLNRLAVDLANDLEFVQAAEHTEAAVALAHETGDERVVATALDSRKLIAAYLGDFGVLGATVATLDGILRRHNDLWILSFALAESAIEPAARARWDEAVGLVEEALAMKRRIGDKSGQPLLLAMLSWVHRSRGAYQNALDTAGEALDVAVEIDHPWWTAWAGANLGATLLELRCPEHAIEPLVRSHAAAEAVGVRSQLLRSCAHLAWTRWLSGDASQADSMLRRAETLLADVHAPDGKAWLFGADAYLAVARLDLARNEPARALEVVTPLVAAADAAGWGEPLALGLALVGRSQWAVGSPESAKTVLTRALAVADTHTLPAPALEAHTALTNICRAEGDQRAADAHSTDALEIITRMADAIRTPDIRERFITVSMSDLSPPASA